MKGAKPGDLVGYQALGTFAIYRVVLPRRSVVHLEVVQSPGLERGARVRFSRAAVENMQVLTRKQARAWLGIEKETQ